MQINCYICYAHSKLLLHVQVHIFIIIVFAEKFYKVLHLYGFSLHYFDFFCPLSLVP